MTELEPQLTNKVALITGAGRGIGKAIALAFAKEGANLVLTALTENEVMQTAAECQKAGVFVLPLITDIAVKEQVVNLVTACIEKFGQIDVLVNSAGVNGPIGPTVGVEVESWVKALEVNLFGPFYLCRAVIPYMLNRKQGKIILLAGGGATAPLPNLSAYAASKVAVVRLAETLAEELKNENIQVNAIAPGLVDTKLHEEILAVGDRAGPLFAKIKHARENGIGAVSPQVSAELAVFLASSFSGKLTGKLIAAPHDPWKDWGGEKADKINASPFYTIRRLDPFTLKPLVKELT